MQITKIENFGKSKIKIYVNEEYKFWLYNKDLNKYPIKEDDDISLEEVEEFLSLNLSRAKKQILNLLTRMDKTRKEVINKLKQSGYPENIIKETLAYIDGFNYIDDKRVARQFVRYKRDTKSKKQIQNQLLVKGVSQEDIEQALQDEYKSEETAIKNAIKKKRRNDEEFSKEDKQKLASSLFNRGFELEIIRKKLDL